MSKIWEIIHNKRPLAFIKPPLSFYYKPMTIQENGWCYLVIIFLLQTALFPIDIYGNERIGEPIKVGSIKKFVFPMLMRYFSQEAVRTKS